MIDKHLEYRNGRVIMKIRCSKFVEDEDGGHFTHYFREEDVTEHADRPNDLCKLCGFPAYPECIEGCSFNRVKKEGRE